MSPFSSDDHLTGGDTRASAGVEGRVYRAIVNAIPDMIIRIDSEGRFRSFEGTTDELLLPEAAYVGRRLQDVLPKETARPFIERIRAAFATGEVQHYQYVLNKDGQNRYYEARISRSTEDEALVIVRNITRQVRTRQELQRYQEQLEAIVRDRTAELTRTQEVYQSIFEHAGAPSVIVESDFTISMANPKFEILTGYGKTAVENRMKYIDLIAAEDAEMVRNYHYARRNRTADVPSEYECRIVDRSGRAREVMVKVGLLPEAGRSIASLIDIASLKRTERDLREREALYSAILEGFEGQIYFVNREFRIRFMNETLIRQIGRNAVGDICYRALHNRTSRCPWCVSEQVFSGETVRFEIKNPNDKKWYYSVNIPIRHTDGSLSYQAMITDIDERKRMEQALRQSEAHLREENLRLRSTIKKRNRFGDIIGSSPAMQEVYELILMAAATDTNIILYGESGTGKELVAHCIHDISDRRSHEFVPVNCGAIPAHLAEREFFGHRKGAFTGALKDTPGFLDTAHGGTLFLDEIGEISLDLQVKLLRAIDGSGYTPIGGDTVKTSNMRIIAATNRNLQERVRQGLMREDFFYRINVIPIHLRPLRDRKEDIPLLIDHFLKAYDRRIRPHITADILDALVEYDWPGNVRELQNVMYRFVALKRLDFLGDKRPAPVPEEMETAPMGELRSALGQFEKRVIERALSENRWNRTRTANALGIGLRTLQRKMNQHGIT